MVASRSEGVKTMSPEDSLVSSLRRRGVDAISDPAGGIHVLAIDHRDSMRRFLSPLAPNEISSRAITNLKIDIVGALIDLATGVMLEPEFSIPQLTGSVPQDVGIIAALESQGYLDDPASSLTTILDGWSPAMARDLGAAMVKLLLPYRPNTVTAAHQEQVAADVIALSREAGMSLVLEPLVWGVEDPSEHASMVVESVRRFASLKPGLMKVPFPGNGLASCDRAAEACQEITSICSVTPWALLSGGGTFEAFETQLTIAMANGCSGFMVGRALWGDAVSVPESGRKDRLMEVVRPRFVRLNEIVSSALTV
jgi:tagatose-1,6-bisphosphate aldolase